MSTYVIVGNGPAGIRAAETIRNNDSEATISVVSDESQLYYYRRLLPRFIAGKYKPENLRVYPPDFYQKKAIGQILGRTVTKVLPEKRFIVLDDSERISYDKLLLAVGGKPIIPNWPGSTLKGVMTIRTLDDAQRMVSLVGGITAAVVVGGGLLGMNLAQSLRERGLEVHLLARDELLWPAMLDQIASKIIAKRLQQEGVQVNFTTEIEKVIGMSDSVSGVQLTGGREIKCELVAASIGIRPNIGFLRDSGLKIDKGILVNEMMQTNVENLYAAGDVAQAYNIVSKDYRLNTSWINALDQGTIAGSNMSGNLQTYRGGVCANSEKIYDIAVTSIGVTSPMSPECEVLAQNFEASNVYRKFVMKRDRIIGALLLGQTRDADRIETLVKTEANVEDIKEKLLPGLEKCN